MSTDNERHQPILTKPNTVGIRHIQVLLYFLAIFSTSTCRSSIGIGIVPMTNNSSNPNFQAYNWKEETRGFLLSSGASGFLIALIPASFLSNRFGAKNVAIIALGLTSTMTMLNPFAASLGWQYLSLSFCLVGFNSGLIVQCVNTLAPKWINPSERWLSITMNSARHFGPFAVMTMGGSMAMSSFGWPGIFYTTGGFSICIAIGWFFLSYESPMKHTYISEAERNYLQMTTKTATKKRLTIPWISIITSLPVLALTGATCAQNFGYFVLISQTPTYLSAIHQFNLKSAGILSGLPFLTMGVLTLFIAPMMNYLINGRNMKRQTVQKLFNTIGHWIPAICLMAMALIENLTGFGAAILLIIAVGVNAGAGGGCVINHFDLSPNFSGTIFALSFTIGSIFSLSGPIYAGFVVNDMYDRSKWNILFYTTAGIYFIGNLGFIIFGKASIQKWNDIKDISVNVNEVCEDLKEKNDTK